MAVDTRLRDVAEELLANLAAALEAEGLDVPTRRYVTAGDVAHDFAGAKCAEAFVITWDGSFQGVVGQGVGNLSNAPIQCAMPLVAQFTIALLRCVETISEMGIAPSAAALNDDGRKILTDANTMAAVTVRDNKDLLPDPLNVIGIGNLQPIGPQGGVGGTTMTVLVGLV